MNEENNDYIDYISFVTILYGKGDKPCIKVKIFSYRIRGKPPAWFYLGNACTNNVGVAIYKLVEQLRAKV